MSCSILCAPQSPLSSLFWPQCSLRAELCAHGHSGALVRPGVALGWKPSIGMWIDWVSCYLESHLRPSEQGTMAFVLLSRLYCLLLMLLHLFSPLQLISSKVPKAEYVPTIIRRDDPSIIPILYVSKSVLLWMRTLFPFSSSC